MTCIVGIVHSNGSVFIGGDSAGVDTRDFALIPRRDRKVVRNGEFLVGFTTSFRMGQILAYALSPPPFFPGSDLMRYMVVDFVGAVRGAFREGGFGEEQAGGTFLVGFKSRLFQIQDDFQVAESQFGFDACGCGAHYALGSLYSTRDQNNPKKRIGEALGCAEAFSAGVRRPFFIEECQG